MNYRMEKTIRRKIVKMDDIIAISEFFQNLTENEGGKYEIDIFLWNKTYLSDVGIEYFSSYGTKDIRSIKFKYQSKVYSNSVSMELEECISWLMTMNKYEIRSSDEKWYNAMRISISDMLKNIQHCNWMRLFFDIPFAVLGHILLLLLISFVLTEFLGFEYGHQPVGARSVSGQPLDSFATENSPIFLPLRDVYSATMLPWYIVCFVVRWLYPDVEFSFDSLRSRWRKKIRKLFIWIFSTIVIPIALTLFL